MDIQARTLMGPGPSSVPARILQTLALPTIGHLDPQFVDIMGDIKTLLQHTFQTENEVTFAVSAPGSAGMETCFVNLIEPGEKVIVCVNGVFGNRMVENVHAVGGIPVILEFEWGMPVDTDTVEQALQDHPDAVVLAFVHAETSTGVVSDAQSLSALAQQYGCYTIADTVTSFAGMELRVDAWGLDAVYTGSQKCLSCVPGLSPVTFSPRAMQKITTRETKVASWMFDLNLVMGYWGKSNNTNAPRTYHHTAPVNSLYALKESLIMVHEEGLENVWHRHGKMHTLLKQGLEDLGVAFVVPEPHRLPMLNLVKIPDGYDDATVRTQLLNNHNLEIGAGLGKFAGQYWRIGIMGNSAREEPITLCLNALKDVLK